MVEETPKGKIWATPGTTAIRDKIPNDVVCSGANSSRVFAEGCLKITPRGAIANDAGIGKNESAIIGVRLLGERFYGTPALIGHCQSLGWDYRLRLKGNLR